MTTNAPILMILIPLIIGLLIPIVGWFNKKLAHPMAVIAMLGTWFAASQTFIQVLSTGPISYKLGNWPRPIGIEYVIDHLNALVLLIIAFVGLMVSLYAKLSIEKELPTKLSQFYTLFVLQITGLLGMTITGDAFNLYVLLEITALTGYALLALGSKRACISTFNYVMVGTIGACLYLLGVGFLLIKTGSLNMYDLFQLIGQIHQSEALVVAFLLIMVGLWIKMAFFPFHGWLPNAYSNAPIAVMCLIAPLATKVTVYIFMRLLFTVFGPNFVFEVISWQPIVMGMSVIAILAGSGFALMQKDLRKMVSYIVVAEVGYMVGGLWLGNSNGIMGAVYHILSDSLMTLCLCMAIGCFIYVTGSSAISSLSGKFKNMPITTALFLVGAFSMIGIPPTCGFFSKWYLILGGLEAGSYAYVAALLISSLVNAILFFRIIEIGYFGKFDAHDSHEGHEKTAITEAPISMLIPLAVVTAMLVVVGLYTNEIMTYVIQFVVPAGIF